jgi:hypothetical protein
MKLNSMAATKAFLSGVMVYMKDCHAGSADSTIGRDVSSGAMPWRAQSRMD